MSTNKKATAVLPDETIANKNTQDNDTTNDKQIPIEILSELATMQRRFAELYQYGLYKIDEEGVYIEEHTFRDTFPNYEAKRNGLITWKYTLTVNTYGTKFYTISQEE